MKPAKFAVCCLLAALCFAIPSRPAALVGTGESSAHYAIATTRNVYFYENIDDAHAMFAIPYTYCVEVLDVQDDWYQVRYAEDAGAYNALSGFCRKAGLTLVDEPPKSVYLNKLITVEFRHELGNTFLPTVGEVNDEAVFYGNLYWDNEAYSYVYYNGKYGYVNGAHEDYPLNELPAEPTPKEGKGANVKLIIVIVLIAAAGLSLLILYFTGKTAKFKRT
ncbi:MAG: hypothetical protein K2N22_06090 [Clostridia bacterium]|nr:hypothetical protein [Clostridia bacterium]